MWDKGPSSGCIALCTAWGLALVLIALGALLDSYWLGQFGIAAVGMGAALLVMRDNARTRAAVRCCIASKLPAQREGENITTLR